MSGDKKLCHWCEMPLPKRPFIATDGGWQGIGGVFCTKQCHADSVANEWPSWMTGRIGVEPVRDWHMSWGFLCISAPNRYRQLFRKRGKVEERQAAIIALQRADYPWLPNPMGLDFDAGPDGAIMASWDQVLIWYGPSLADARAGMPTPNCWRGRPSQADPR